MWSEIDVNLPLVAKLSDAELEHIFLHEMAHIMISPIKPDNVDLEEFVVTRLAMAFHWIEDLL